MFQSVLTINFCVYSQHTLYIYRIICLADLRQISIKYHVTHSLYFSNVHLRWVMVAKRW